MFRTGASLFSDGTTNRIAGSTHGTLEYNALMALFPSMPDDVLVTPIQRNLDGVSYTRGVS